MAVRTWWTNEDLMVVEVQRTDISLMAIGAQCTSDNPRTGVTRSHQQNSTKMQRTDVSSSASDAQQTDVDPRAETIHPYPQNPRET